MWLLLAFQLPSDPGYLRVKLWRRLHDIGAVSFRNALYVLPAGESAEEDLQWVLREVRAAGGDGAVFQAQLQHGMTDDAMRALFDAAREADYAALAEELRAVVEGLGTRRQAADRAGLASELTRYRRRLAQIEAIDFFNTSGRATVHALLRRLDERLPATPQENTMADETRPPQLRARTWVTRAHVKVDRMASAWLIRRRIDPEATFKFVADRSYRPAKDEVRFDMYEGEFTHDADRCTFEVLLDLVHDKDAGLVAIAEIVHDLDLKDRRYEREETAGVAQLLEGIIAGCDRDEDRLARSAALFDDLHRSLARPGR
jgi:hypothetical protein